MTNYRFLQLDVFTNLAFAGNPLAVFPGAEGLSDENMMKIAREMNLSETVFVLKPDKEQSAASNQQSAEPATEETDKPQAAYSNDDTATGNDSPHHSGKHEVLRRLRIFTPAREIPFAGHPVVGTWNALAREGVVPVPETGNGWTRIYHELGIGVLPVDIEFENGVPVQVVMTQGKADM